MITPPETIFPTPFRSPTLVVERSWIDYNGHMNVAYYVVMFDRAIDGLFEALGIGRAYVEERRASFFTVALQVRYLRELTLGTAAYATIQLLETDAKRLRVFQELRATEDDALSATAEQVFLHVDMGSRRAAPVPEDVRSRLNAVVAAHAALGTPAGAGEPIGLKPIRRAQPSASAQYS